MQHLGGAKALDLDDKLGNFNVGKEADFVVLNIKPTALQIITSVTFKSLEDSLFALFTMGMIEMSRQPISMDKKPIAKTKILKKQKFGWIIVGYWMVLCY